VSHLLREARDIGVRHLLLTGGEPLLYPDLPEVLDLASGLNLKVIVASNLAFASPRDLEILHHDAISLIQTSLDGAEDPTHDAIRGVDGAFDSTCRNIGRLLESGVRVAVTYTVTKENLGEVEQAIDMAERDKFSMFSINDLVCLGRARRTARQPVDKAEYESLRQLFAQRRSKSPISLPWRGAGPRIKVGDKDRDFIISRCGACLTKCAIGPGGQVYPCVFLPTVVGQWGATNLADLWTSPGFQPYQERHTLQGKCGSCDFTLGCSGCRARAYAFYNDHRAEDPRCNYNESCRDEGENK